MSRRKSVIGSIGKSPKALFFIFVLFVAVVPAVFLGQLLPVLAMPVWITIIVLIYVLKWTIKTISQSPTHIGKVGERKVNRKLRSICKKYGGEVFYNVMLTDPDNLKSSQIDHIYVSDRGVFVIETKNYSGRVYGSTDQNEWTQVLAYGNVKHKLYNPVKQNLTHVIVLNKKLRLDEKKIKSIVVFTKNNTMYIKASGVYALSELKGIIKTYPKNELSAEEVLFAKIYIQDSQISNTVTDQQHVQEIKIMLNNIENNICPRCGAPLVERQSSNGKKFYGCSNYPKCKFKKRM